MKKVEPIRTFTRIRLLADLCCMEIPRLSMGVDQFGQPLFTDADPGL
jgi:hypothetical protein